jgi:xanthine dehydrogenase YagS FAD-binding subunit
MYRFEHTNAYTLGEATALLEKGNAAVIAGGTDILPTLKGMCTPDHPELLVNIKTIPDLDYIREEGGTLKIGALATLTKIANSSIVRNGWEALAEAAFKVAAPELRNMGTIGGNICQKPRCIYYRKEFNIFNCARKKGGADCFALTGVNRFHSIFGPTGGSCFAICPSDIAPALVALGAIIVTTKKADWKAEDFFTVGNKDDQINDIDSDEIVKEIQIPALASGTKSVYKKFAFRKAIDFPLVSVAAVITSSGGNASNASIVLGGVYNEPKRASEAEASINGKTINEANATTAGEEGLKNSSAALAQAKYKIQIAKTLIKRAILDCR